MSYCSHGQYFKRKIRNAKAKAEAKAKAASAKAEAKAKNPAKKFFQFVENATSLHPDIISIIYNLWFVIQCQWTKKSFLITTVALIINV